jgi:hypothetical protein
LYKFSKEGEMALKIISFIFVISLAFGIQNLNLDRDLPFDVNEVIHQITPRNPLLSKYQSLISSCPTDEFLIDTSIVYVGAPNIQWEPAIAFDGTNYLVVWAGKRISGSTSYDIFGARVTQAGTVLDPLGITISTATRTRRNPSIAFDGTNYFVVWHDLRNINYDIYGARVTQAGTVLDTNGIAVSIASDGQYNPAIAFDGTNYLVVWEDVRNDTLDIYGARVSQNGIVLDTNGIPISIAIDRQRLPSVDFDGINYLVVWQDYRGYYVHIYGTRVSQTGTVLDTNGFAISTASYGKYCPSIAFDGTNYLVVWFDFRYGICVHIYGSRVSQAGIVLDPEGIAISTASNTQQFPSVAFDGTNYFVVWQDRSNAYDDIFGARVTQAGTVLDPHGIPISTATHGQRIPSVAFDETNYLVVWFDYRSGFPDIYGTRVTQAGTVLDSNDFVISTVVNYQENPTISFDGTNYLVVWIDYRNDSADIYGTRISQDGTVLDPDAIAISTVINNQLYPAIVFDGINYLVVWEDASGDTSDIYGTRVTQAGIVLDTNGIAISTAANNQQYPSVSFDGINYLVVWIDYRNDSADIYGTRITQAGTILEPNGFAISTATNNQLYPDIAFDGINYLVVWEDIRSGAHDIYGARVTQAGTVLDSNGFAISTAANNQQYPNIAFDGTNYLLVWQDNRGGIYDVYGTRLSQAGTVLDTNGIAISTAVNDQESPCIVFDSTNYLVVWTDSRSGSFTDIYGVRVNSSGVLFDSFPVSIREGNQELPALAHGSGNQVLITYQGWVGEYQGKTYNTMRIWGKLYPGPGIKEDNSRVKMQKAKLLEVYPNPAKSYFTIRLPQTADRQNLKIFDVSGKMIKEIEILRGVYPASFEKRDCFAGARNDKRCGAQNDRAGDIKISLKGINPGIYFLRFGKETKKFLVVK